LFGDAGERNHAGQQEYHESQRRDRSAADDGVVATDDVVIATDAVFVATEVLVLRNDPRSFKIRLSHRGGLVVPQKQQGGFKPTYSFQIRGEIRVIRGAVPTPTSLRELMWDAMELIVDEPLNFRDSLFSENHPAVNE
jgi:hypothetical protein